MNKKSIGGVKKIIKNKKPTKKRKQSGKLSKKKNSKIDQDRNWIKPPNSITKDNTKISYWIDKTGEAQLYTQEQLAKCNILMNINVLLNKSLILFGNLQKMDKDTTVGTLIQQDYAQFETSEPSVYTHFMKLMAATSDITFSEFLNFISQGDDSKAFSKLGKSKLKKVVKDDKSDVVSFFTSDKLKKS